MPSSRLVRWKSKSLVSRMTVVSEARAGRESGGQTHVLEAQELEIVRVQTMPGSLWLAVRDVPCIVQMCLSYRHQGARPPVELTV